MTPLETLTLRLAAQVIANNSDVAPERILNFADDAKAAIKTAVHRTFPTAPDDEQGRDRYNTIKEAAKVVEDFHGGKI